MARVTATAVIFLLALASSAMSVTVQEFFANQDIKTNLTKVTWAHAVNTKQLLDNELKSNDTKMMIEADVSFGKLKPSTGNEPIPDEPVMAHDLRDAVIDLKLKDFIKTVLESKKSGMKLDFKSIDALEKSVEVINSFVNMTVPLWVNADILKGPNANQNTAVDAERFLAAVQKINCKPLLSVGWTTNTTSNAEAGTYTQDQVDSMIKVLNGTNVTAVTYPVRAVFAMNDSKEKTTLEKLLKDSKDKSATLTIWSAKDDKVNATLLSAVIKRIGVDKVYVDVPQSLQEKLQLNGAFGARSSASLLLASLLVVVATFKVL